MQFGRRIFDSLFLVAVTATVIVPLSGARADAPGAQGLAAGHGQIETTGPGAPAWRQDFKTGARLLINGGGDMISSQGGNRNVPMGAQASALLSLGSGAVSLETGAIALHKPVMMSTIDANGATESLLGRPFYVGVPLALKYNYLERRMNSFGVKIGAMRSWITNHDQVLPSDRGARGDSYQINRVVDFALAGFTGTASLSADDAIAFIIDGTYLQNISDADNRGTKLSGLYLSVGLMFAL